MKLVINNDTQTITVYGQYAIDDILDEIEKAGLDHNEWVIHICPVKVWTQDVSYPYFYNDYEIKA